MPSMVHTIDGIEVVPNNRLKAYLEREVRTRAQAINLPGRQIPDTQVVSNDSTYIGQVRRVDPPVPPPITDQPATVQQLAIADLQRFGIRGAMSGNAPTTASIERLSAEIGYTVAGVAVRRPGDTSRLGRRGGFWVSGAVVTSVVSSPSIQLERLDAGDGQGQPGLIRINSTEARARAGSVAMRFADGTGTVVAALDGFVASVSVDRVTYPPQEPLIGPNMIGNAHASIPCMRPSRPRPGLACSESRAARIAHKRQTTWRLGFEI
jgi:hypothetical protein